MVLRQVQASPDRTLVSEREHAMSTPAYDRTPQAYTLEFTLPGLPRMSNSLLRGHWRAKHGHAMTWKRAVWRACWQLAPKEPLERAKLTLVRCSSVEPDFDGLVSSMKHVIDGLVEARIISNDKSANIGVPEYKWERAKPAKGCVKVKVEELCEP